jgi:hypothetical protein
MAYKREKLPKPLAVAELLSAVFRGTPTEKRLKEGSIWQVWDCAVGKQIASRARPVSFRAGTLTVAVSSAPWMQQLTFLKKGIMEKLNGLLGEELVLDIYLKAGKAEPAKSRKPPEIRHERPLSPGERQKIAEQTDSVSDPELRQVIERLLSRHLERSDKK